MADVTAVLGWLASLRDDYERVEALQKAHPGQVQLDDIEAEAVRAGMTKAEALRLREEVEFLSARIRGRIGAILDDINKERVEVRRILARIEDNTRAAG